PDTQDYSFPQLISDGQNGFFISYLKNNGSASRLFVTGYKEVGNQLVSTGGGEMNRNAYITETPGSCGISKSQITYEVPAVKDYFIWADGQGGCNVVMSMHGKSAAGVYASGILGYNRLFKVKKDKKAVVHRRIGTTKITESKFIERNYKKDSLVVLYTLMTFSDQISCFNAETNEVYTYTNYHIENGGYGFLTLDEGHDFHFSKGTTLPTSGSINIDVLAATKRTYSGNSLSKFTPVVYALPSEIYDAIPYQLDSDDYAWRAIRFEPEGKVLDKVNFSRDTLLASGYNFLEFSMKSSGSKIFATAKIRESLDQPDNIYLQQLEVEKGTDNSFNIKLKTSSKKGTLIGKEISTGFGSTNLLYDRPQLAVDGKGNAIFYITDLQRSIRISPIRNATELSWGAMGKPIGTAVFKGSHYSSIAPFVALDATDGTGVIAWSDYRNYLPNTSSNVYIRQISGLFSSTGVTNLSVKNLAKGKTSTMPSYLTGSSKAFSTLEVSRNSPYEVSPVAEIEDNYHLGLVEMNVYQHEGDIRKYQDTAYLSINYTIKPENEPTGALNVRLFFTEQDFSALQEADPTLLNPGNLMVLQQPNNSVTVPSEYTPVEGEKEITPTAWKEVPGGYYLEFPIEGFSNFFIMRNKKPEEVPLAVSKPKIKEAISLYPNPVDTEFYIKGLKVNDHILVTDVVNRILKKEIVSTTNHSVGLSNFKAGIYLVKIIRGSQSEVFKVIKL
nr:T9SS type A sorting domain-containing protein [Bacteroidota bacterium]